MKARTGPPRYNGGTLCDMDEGPCACGAWHQVSTLLEDFRRSCEEMRKDTSLPRENLCHLRQSIIRACVQHAVDDMVRDLMPHDEDCGISTNLKCDCSRR